MLVITSRRLQSALMLLIVTVPLFACASRPENGYLTPVAGSSSITAEHTILVATTRQRDTRPGTLFNGERTSSLDYASITVSVPPTHVPGKVELASSAPGKPEKSFVVRDADYLDSEQAFIQSLNAQLAQRPPGSRRVLLFIHGYNTMFAEGLYRFAQVVHDSKAVAVPVLFTWASRGKVSEYVYDNNSATVARNDLEHTLRLILASNAEEVNILAHSMGNWVTVEAFRQIKISGDLENTNKIGNVFLAAPDIDLDVFKAQMRRIGRPDKPVYIVISKDDVALGFSKFIAGGQVRVGDATNAQELADLGVTVIDLTNLEGEDASNHAKFAQLTAVGPELRTVLGKGLGQSTAQRQQSAAGTLGAILGAPIRIISGQ
ncbi:alpha/beta hydrolase [Aestuariivirga sp.]|uniref:alpha/beta hydrolase n=1 Tax=Aestuariivirga sp. TaxID=2650926 RepID=UPI003593F2E3